MENILEFLIFYPILMSVFWIIGTLLYYFLNEFRLNKKPSYEVESGISFIVPCYNEGENIEETIRSLTNLTYPLKEVIAVNDGSSDDTGKILYQLTDKYDFKFIDLEKNLGKANALNTAVKNAKHDYVIVIDADTLLDDDAPYFMMEKISGNEKLGAVTGNPRIRNKSTLLGKIQTVEYASIIGCIKRTQVMTGFVNTISGVFTIFNKKALKEVDYFDTDMITEDIAVSWKFHFAGYTIAYEPRALCRMLVPESLNGLFKQRIRWAQGGHEVILRDFKKMLKARNPALWFMYLEQVFSIIWVYCIITSLVIILLDSNFLDYYFYVFELNLIVLSIFLLTFVNIIQFTLSLMIDSRYEKKNIFYLIFLSWYPVMYWLVNAIVSVIAFPRALKRKKGEFATWTSPDRGDILP